MSVSPFLEPAEPILRGDPAITDEQRADLFDAFHSKNADELVQHLQPLMIPDDTKKRLLDAKKLSIPPAVEPMDKVAAVMTRMTQLDPQALELAESHPNVFKTMTAAATAPEKGPAGPAGASKAAPKGDTAAGAAQATPLTQPPRPDGLQHLPPIPDGHHRVLASDGGIHDIPVENLEKARAIDPRLHVLNP